MHVKTYYFSSRRKLRLIVVFLSSVFGLTLNSRAAIVRIEITSVESPTFEGRMFGKVGPYEKLKGRAYGEVDPNQPQNALITDINYAPRNNRGMVEYSMDIYILKPVNMELSNHKLFAELPNRGSKLFGGFNKSTGGNDPTTAVEAGEGFLMQMGYTLVWSGWDIAAGKGNNNLTITVPTAINKDGTAITGPSYEYISFDNNKTSQYRLNYPAASLAKEKAELTVRKLLNDTAQMISPQSWEYTDDRTIRLLPAGTPFQQSAIYEFTYTAKNPLVAGLGLAATRDFISFLRYGKKA
ncbi:MAG: hypothetical protein EOP45_20370, partial [Sphingobacteriaceae bacterium]